MLFSFVKSYFEVSGALLIQDSSPVIQVSFDFMVNLALVDRHNVRLSCQGFTIVLNSSAGKDGWRKLTDKQRR